jgi:hypothetical protein
MEETEWTANHVKTTAFFEVKKRFRGNGVDGGDPFQLPEGIKKPLLAQGKRQFLSESPSRSIVGIKDYRH